MSKWTKANEYVPVTNGATAVITLQNDGDIYGYMDASTTGVLLASASAGVAKVPTGSFSKITCTAPFILTTESAMSRLRGGQGGTSGGGSTGNNWITANEAGEAVLNFPDKTNPTLENLCISFSRYTKLTGSTRGKTNCVNFCWFSPTLKELDVEVPNGNTSNMFPNCNSLTKAKLIAPVSRYVNSIFHNDTKLQDVYLYAPTATIYDYMVTNASNIETFTFNLAAIYTINFTSSGIMGNLPKLQNVTVLEGGLASCTSFIITNSTNLTDESIQNIIDALPDYSGSETSALVSFPPDRLSTEQQAQLTNKGWTWS